MRFPFTRRPLPPAPPEDAPRQIDDLTEAEIAVGSLSGIAPSRILRHLLVVVDDTGELHMSTTLCKNELPDVVGLVGRMAREDAMEPGPCEHGSHS